MILLCDLDGTLADYDTAMAMEQQKLASPYEKDFSTDSWKKYSERTEWQKARGDLIRSKSGFWKNLKPIEPSMYLVSFASINKIEVHVLTKGPSTKPHAWAEKLEWVRTHLGDHIPVHIVSDKGLFHGDVLFDDWPEYNERWLASNPNGLVIIPDRSYNAHWQHPRAIRWFQDDRKSGQDVFSKLLELSDA